MLPSNYFIAGLPRSRTAWLAAFMCNGDSFCYHEAAETAKTIDDYVKKMTADHHKYIGDSDCGIPFIEIDRLFPCSKVIVIDRNVDDVIESLGRIKFRRDKLVTDYPAIIKEAHARLLNMKNDMTVKYEEINDALPDIWKLCTNTDVDKQRMEQFIRLNIQSNHLEVTPCHY